MRLCYLDHDIPTGGSGGGERLRPKKKIKHATVVIKYKFFQYNCFFFKYYIYFQYNCGDSRYLA